MFCCMASASAWAHCIWGLLRACVGGGERKGCGHCGNNLRSNCSSPASISPASLMHGCSSGGTAWEGLGIMLLRRVCCVCGPIFLRHVVAGTVVVQDQNATSLGTLEAKSLGPGDLSVVCFQHPTPYTYTYTHAHSRCRMHHPRRLRRLFFSSCIGAFE